MCDRGARVIGPNAFTHLPLSIIEVSFQISLSHRSNNCSKMSKNAQAERNAKARFQLFRVTTHKPPVYSQIRFYPRLRTARHMIASIVILFILLLKFCLFCDRIMFIGGKCRYFPRNFQIFSRKSVEKRVLIDGQVQHKQNRGCACCLAHPLILT